MPQLKEVSALMDDIERHRKETALSPASRRCRRRLTDVTHGADNNVDSPNQVDGRRLLRRSLDTVFLLLYEYISAGLFCWNFYYCNIVFTVVGRGTKPIY